MTFGFVDGPPNASCRPIEGFQGLREQEAT